MRKILTRITAVSLYLAAGYIALCFIGWDFNPTHWHWFLRLVWLSMGYVPFAKQNFVKI